MVAFWKGNPLNSGKPRLVKTIQGQIDEEKSRLKQRILTAAKIAPTATSSSSSSRTMSKAEKEEKERQVMRVAFEESGEVVGKAGATSSMEMTAMDFRSIVASDEARAFREDAARRILRGGLLLLPGFQSLHQDDGKHFSSNMDLSFSFVYDWLPWENICIPCLTLKASLPLKMDAWNTTILSFWVSASFQGLWLLLGGGFKYF